MSDEIQHLTPLDWVERLDRHLAEVEAWTNGSRSWTNLGWDPPYTPDVIAVMDAQEVVKHSAAAQAYAAALGAHFGSNPPPEEAS